MFKFRIFRKRNPEAVQRLVNIRVHRYIRDQRREFQEVLRLTREENLKIENKNMIRRFMICEDYRLNNPLFFFYGKT